MPAMKYWEIIADKLSAAGFSWGYCSAVTKDGWRWIVDARREGRRYVVHSHECLAHSLNWKRCRAVRGAQPDEATMLACSSCVRVSGWLLRTFSVRFPMRQAQWK